MNKHLAKLVCIIGLLSNCNWCNSQTTIISYLNSGLSTSACNVFSPSVSISGVLHSSHAGGVTFNSTNGIGLSTSPQVNPSKATAYIINYNFIPGHNYNITITAIGNTALQMKTSVVPNLVQFPTNGTAQCPTDVNVSSYQTVGVGQFSSATSTTSANYNIPQFSIPGTATYPYLIVWVSGGNISQSIDVLYISQVVITQTTPVSFTLSPSNLSVACGSTTPQTFRVTNVYNTPNVTNYRWNLGANNGWLNNGIAAPETISTGTVDSLMLTPACSDVKHNISVTVTAGGNNYQTNSVSVSNSSPTLSINGSSAFCLDSSSYFLDGVPCRASVSWISSNTSIATVTSTGNPATLTKTGDGTLTLTATVNGVNCLSNNAALKSVAVGAPQANNISLWNSAGSITIGQPVGFVAGYPPANRCQIQSTEWQVLNMGYSIYTGNFPCEPDNETSKNIFLESEGTAYVQARIQNSCGWSNWSAAVPIQVSSGYYFLVSPNPATSTIAVSPKATTTDEISEIRIYDNMGNLKKQMRYSKGTKRTQLNIGDLGNGYYFIEVIASQKRDRQQLIIQR